jgi:dTDP-4-dehydrorhamnose reductase
MRIILLGKNGQVGRELEQLLPKLGIANAYGREELDVSNLLDLEMKLLDIKPDLIINASAYTEVDQAEKEPEKAIRVNSEAPGVMAEVARKINAVFIHYSTDYVFDGNHKIPYKENEDTNPLNVYGRSKLAGEKNISQAGGAYLILRTSWVYSMRGNTFVNKVQAWARNKEVLHIVDDQVSNPTWARALAEITYKLVSTNSESLPDIFKERCGIYHVAGNGFTTRFNWAKQILANASDRTDLLARTIEPVSSEAFPMPATRPLFSALDCSKFEDTFHIRLPDWKDSLKEAMTE